jgi:transposase
MLSLSRHVRVFVATAPLDMRGSFDAMAGRVRRLGLEPVDGALYVFFSRSRTMLAVLHFDGSGWCLFRKRLERGTFQFPPSRRGPRRGGRERARVHPRRDRPLGATSSLVPAPTRPPKRRLTDPAPVGDRRGRAHVIRWRRAHHDARQPAGHGGCRESTAPLRERARLLGREEPTDDVAAEQVDDDVKVVPVPALGAANLGDFPGPDLVRWSSLTPGERLFEPRTADRLFWRVQGVHECGAVRIGVADRPSQARPRAGTWSSVKCWPEGAGAPIPPRERIVRRLTPPGRRHRFAVVQPNAERHADRVLPNR